MLSSRGYGPAYVFAGWSSSAAPGGVAVASGEKEWSYVVAPALLVVEWWKVCKVCC